MRAFRARLRKHAAFWYKRISPRRGVISDMPEKKKSSAIRRSEKSSADATAAGALDGSATGPKALPDSQRQFACFEAAMRLFHTRDLREARQSFEQAARGPERDVAQRARLHIAMCDRRLEQAGPVLRTAEDYYNYGITLINARNLGAARENLQTALQMAPDADHIQYALGLAQALSGDVAAAHESLKRAIELEPRNRVIARQDADLAPWAGQPPLDSLLYPDKKNW